MHYENLYYTSNIEFAALLLSMNQTLESCFVEGGEYIFVFQDETNCKKIIIGFLNDRLSVNAKSLFVAINTVRAMINAS